MSSIFSSSHSGEGEVSSELRAGESPEAGRGVVSSELIAAKSPEAGRGVVSSELIAAESSETGGVMSLQKSNIHDQLQVMN